MLPQKDYRRRKYSIAFTNFGKLHIFVDFSEHSVIYLELDSRKNQNTHGEHYKNNSPVHLLSFLHTHKALLQTFYSGKCNMLEKRPYKNNSV